MVAYTQGAYTHIIPTSAPSLAPTPHGNHPLWVRHYSTILWVWKTDLGENVPLAKPGTGYLRRRKTGLRVAFMTV